MRHLAYKEVENTIFEARSRTGNRSVEIQIIEKLRRLADGASHHDSKQLESDSKSQRLKQKSLILAQIERWRRALHMQVERQHGLRSGGEWRTGE